MLQPRLKGHRCGMDAMLLAGLVPSNFSGTVLDIGAGAGAVGFAVAARCKDARVILLERSSFMAHYARASLALPQNVLLASRLRLIEGDITARGGERRAFGLFENSIDFALMNPPFNKADDRQTPDKLKAEAHVMPANLFEDWLRAAASLVRPSGFLGLIARPSSLRDILVALDGRFGGAQLIPLHPRPFMPAIRILLYAQRASRAPLSFLPPLILHDAVGHNFTTHVDAINNGRLSFWDTRL